MEDSRKRVQALLNGETPDRPPLYELIRNDAVIEHFTGEALTPENGDELVIRTIPLAVDTTRPALKAPQKECERTLSDGRRQVLYRWTAWTERVSYDSSEGYAAAKEKMLVPPWDWSLSDQSRLDQHIKRHRDIEKKLGDDFFLFWSGPSVGLMSVIGEVGLEQFCYYLADCPEIIDEQLERNTEKAVQWCHNLPEDHGIEAVFSGDDIAYTNGPMLSPAWFKEHYMDRLRRVVDGFHTRGIKVNFHSDGNLMSIMDGLVQAGIDLLNPIEVLSGMDIAELHRRYPDLILTGGIDVSQLLPFGTPDEVRGATKKAIDDSEGNIMIGSSTELHHLVPLANFLAMRDAVLETVC